MTMPNENVPFSVSKPTSSPILDRFRELLRLRDEEFRASSYDGDVPPPTPSEIVRMYEDVLSELTLNSKPIITDLTIIAGEQRAHAEGIADAISARILEVVVEYKLPSLYLLDSIVKNIGSDYTRFFSSHLPEVFCEAYRQVSPDMHTSMQHLFRTWSTVFSSSILHVIEAELQFPKLLKHQSSGFTNAMASQSSRPLHGIHVNPKYLEGRCQIDGESVSNNLNNGIYKIYGQKPNVGYEDYDSDHSEGVVPKIDAQRLSSSVYGGHESLSIGADKLLSSVGVPSRVARGNGEAFDWRNRREVETYKQGNGHKRDRTRALIDAYGQDNRQRTIDEYPHKFGSRVMDGMDGKMVARPWQHIEEEEFDWQDMNPSLGTDMLSSGSSRTQNGVDPFGRGSSTFSLRRSWPGDSHMSSADGSSKFADDLAPSLDVAHGSASKHPFLQEFVQKPDSINPQGAQNFSASSVSSTVNVPLPLHVNHLPDADAQIGGFQLLPSGLRPPVNLLNPQEQPSGSGYTLQMLNNKVMNQGPQQFNSGGLKNLGIANAPPRLPMQQRFLRPQEPWHNYPPPPHPSQNPSQPSSRGYFSPAYGVGPGNPMMNRIPSGHPSNHSSHLPSSLFQQGTVLPFPSRPSLHPHIRPFSQNSMPNSNPSFGIANSGFVNQLSVQDSTGVEFNQDFLKVRNESAIKGLYANLPRQCTTCALRFKTQEEHSKHMDWHVTKNRISKNRKQNPSRKWFVSTAMWLSGAEALGTDAAPNFFLPTDTAEEKQDEEELAVPADDDQKSCALCGESFEDFYSDETDEWMYKGAVYLNAPGQSTVGMDVSLVGPIVHAKCRSATSDVPKILVDR